MCRLPEGRQGVESSFYWLQVGYRYEVFLAILSCVMPGSYSRDEEEETKGYIEKG